jgi:hypothetical protein
LVILPHVAGRKEKCKKVSLLYRNAKQAVFILFKQFFGIQYPKGYLNPMALVAEA